MIARTSILMAETLVSLSGCGGSDRDGKGGGVIEQFPGDLILPLVAAPQTATIGGVIEVQVRVQNVGDRPISAGTRVTIFLSADNVVTALDRILFEADAPPLGTGAFVDLFLDVLIPVDVQPGVLFFIGAIVDAANLVSEAAEDNNGAVEMQGITFSGSKDIVGGMLDGPAAACPGQVVDVVTSVGNLGDGDVRDLLVGLYLSTDPLITATDTRLLSFTVPVPFSVSGQDPRFARGSWPAGSQRSQVRPLARIV